MSEKNLETELTLYARISDPESLDEAELIEDHIQLESTLISGARTRVRKVTPLKGGPVTGVISYIQTLKIPTEEIGGLASCEEVEVDVDRGWYEAFAKVAHRGIVKRRYSFVGGKPVISGAEDLVIPAVVYEVDRFKNPETKQYSEWIKIDIELDAVLKALKEAGIDTSGIRQRFDLTRLPFTSSDMFTAKTATPEQKKILGQLWENEFSIKLAPDTYVELEKSSVENPTPAVQDKDELKVDEQETQQEESE